MVSTFAKMCRLICFGRVSNGMVLVSPPAVSTMILTAAEGGFGVLGLKSFLIGRGRLCVAILPLSTPSLYRLSLGLCRMVIGLSVECV